MRIGGRDELQLMNKIAHLQFVHHKFLIASQKDDSLRVLYNIGFALQIEAIYMNKLTTSQS